MELNIVNGTERPPSMSETQKYVARKACVKDGSSGQPDHKLLLCVRMHIIYLCNNITSDLQDMIWGEPELTMLYALL